MSVTVTLIQTKLYINLLFLVKEIKPQKCEVVGLPSEKAMAPTRSSALASRIPWTEEPGRLQSMRAHRVGRGYLACTGPEG